MATYVPVTKFWALNTSLKVPSPNFLTNLYSVENYYYDKYVIKIFVTVHIF